MALPAAAILAGSQAISAIGGAILGRKKAPQMAAAPQVNIGEAQADAINANSQNFGAAAALSSRANNFAQGEAERMLERSIPGFSALRKQLLDSVDADLKSKGLDPDVQAQMQRFAAEKGITRGTRGGFNQFSLVKDFGFNLTDWNNAKRARALNTLSTVFGMAPRVNPTSPMAMFVDTNTAINTKRDNAMAAYNVQQAGFNAQADASNYNRSLWAAAFQSTANAAGMTAGYKVDPAGMRELTKPRT